MSDRELLELAAKAAGLAERHYSERSSLGKGIHHSEGIWNPLTDDGDALRLAVKLGMKVEQYCYDGDYYCRVYWDGLAPPAVEFHNSDPYAATRRAIVRAAAEIGKEMK